MHYPTENVANFFHAGVTEPTTINIAVPQCLAGVVQKYIVDEYDLEESDIEHDEISQDFPVTTLSYDTSVNGWELQHDLVALKKWPVHIEVGNSSDEYAFLYTRIHEGALVYSSFSQGDECVAAKTVLTFIEKGDIAGLVHMCNEARERSRHWTFTTAEVEYASQIALRELVKPS